MIEIFIPFFLPALGAFIAWLTGYSLATIWITGLLILVLQFVVIGSSKVVQAIRQRYNAFPSRPPCRCGGRLKSTSRGGGYRCVLCNRLYHHAAGQEDRGQLVEKLATGYTLAYLKTKKWGRWEADIPLCRCGSSVKNIGSRDDTIEYGCSSCKRQYREISRLGEGVWFVEVVDNKQLVPYMKSVRWDRWEKDVD